MIELHKFSIIPASMYGAEVWTMTIAEALVLAGFGRKVLTMIYGISLRVQVSDYSKREEMPSPCSL